jgi:flagellar hook-associated protein 1 FlgK
VLAERLSQLDELANALVNQVNELHAEGYDLNGNQGAAFFNAGSGGAAGISVRSLLLEDPDRLAASADGGSGNGDQASRIAELASLGLDALRGHSLEEAWSLMVSATGAERRSASLEFEAQQSFVSNLDSRRQAVSGVNLDEELTLMMSQEQAYAAAARVVSVADELMQTVLGLVS